MRTSIGIIVGFFFLLIAVHFGAEEPHDHQEKFYKRVGVTDYYITICYTEQAQVYKSGRHVQNQRSELYFNGE